MSKVTLRRDELVAEATRHLAANTRLTEFGDLPHLLADFAMMIAARVAVRMMPPPGHVVVPREPTREMVLAAAGRKHEDDEETLFYGAIYRAMIAEATRKEDGE